MLARPLGPWRQSFHPRSPGDGWSAWDREEGKPPPHPPNSTHQFPRCAVFSLESPSLRSFNHCPLSTLFGETRRPNYLPPPSSPGRPSPRMARLSPLLTAPNRRLESHSTCPWRPRGDPPDQWCLEEGPRTGRPRSDHSRLGHTICQWMALSNRHRHRQHRIFSLRDAVAPNGRYVSGNQWRPSHGNKITAPSRRVSLVPRYQWYVCMYVRSRYQWYVLLYTVCTYRRAGVSAMCGCVCIRDCQKRRHWSETRPATF